MNGQWRLLLRALGRTERDRLGRGERVRGAELSPAARGPAREIARAIWWRLRRDKASAVRWASVESDSFEIEAVSGGGLVLAVTRVARTIAGFTDRYPPVYQEPRPAVP
jgi:hypothetical protein